ncbi:hypothetical protein [Reyranella sp.]|uniref:hypothetical protein n=1 Tax=Reyranella sp. TaxID=1929291 RepID=UPI003BAB316B
MTPTRFRWFVVFLLFAITAVNYVDRAAISYAIPRIQHELGLSPEASGAILGAFFEDGFLLVAALALSSVAAVLLFHHPDRDREASDLQA